jgi:hypothetical protein
MTEIQDDVNARLDADIDHPCTPTLIGQYFDHQRSFAGETFDCLGDNPPNKLVIDDLFAVSMLDVTLKQLAVRQILGRDSTRLSGLLASLPADRDLWEADDENLIRAEELWDVLRENKYIDWVIAGKLLARKRPWMIPIVDSVVVDAIGAPPGEYWHTYRVALRDEDRRRRLAALRPEGLDERVSVLRLLDVAVWMRHSRSGSARQAREAAGCA